MRDPILHEQAVTALMDRGFTREKAESMLDAIKQEIEADDYRDDVAKQIG